MPLLDEVGAYLEANSTRFTIGGASGTLFASRLDDNMPNTCTVLFEEAGFGTAQAFSTGTQVDRVYEQPSIQVLSRSTSYVTARANAGAVYDLLDGLSNTTMTGVRYLSIDAVQAPFAIGRDENERHLVSVNFNIKKATT